VLVALCAASAHAHAQGGSLSVQTVSDLSVGTVIAGTSVVITPTDGRAGRFVIQGPPNQMVRLQFALPSAISSGAVTLPITFSSTSAIWSAQNQPATGTPFDPRQDIEIRIPSGRVVYIWLGTQLSPPSAQPAAAYAGPVTLTVSRQ
jgi:hypothetical protein